MRKKIKQLRVRFLKTADVHFIKMKKIPVKENLLQLKLGKFQHGLVINYGQSSGLALIFQIE